jgi:predicted DNA-binding protein with PD1-like motif
MPTKSRTVGTRNAPGNGVAGYRVGMKVKELQTDAGLRTFVVVMDKGDEAAGQLRDFARDHRVNAAGLTAVGGCRGATLGYFDAETTDKRSRTFDGQMEVLSLIGDIATEDGVPAVHAHVVLGRSDYTTIGGHVQQMIVYPTMEVIVTETPGHLAKRIDPETGMALIDLELDA